MFLWWSSTKIVQANHNSSKNMAAKGQGLFEKSSCQKLLGLVLPNLVCSFISSPEPKAQGEVLWSLTVRRRRRRCPSVHSL